MAHPDTTRNNQSRLISSPARRPDIKIPVIMHRTEPTPVLFRRDNTMGRPPATMRGRIITTRPDIMAAASILAAAMAAAGIITVATHADSAAKASAAADADITVVAAALAAVQVASAVADAPSVVAVAVLSRVARAGLTAEADEAVPAAVTADGGNFV